MTSLALTTPSTDGDSGWDLYVDFSGNIATVSGAQELAQNVGTAIRTFRGECWYDRTLGVPYFQQVLGKRLSLQYFKGLLISAGSIVRGVQSIRCFLTGPDKSRRVGGQLQIMSNGQVVAVVETGDLSGTLPWWAHGINPPRY